jgi:hypothetical protein
VTRNKDAEVREVADKINDLVDHLRLTVAALQEIVNKPPPGSSHSPAEVPAP